MKSVSFKKPVTVIEIGNDWLKIAENAPSALGRVISKVSLVKLAQINEPVAAALARIFKEHNLNKQGVVTYLPRHLVTVRVLEFPSTDPKEINDMVGLQVTKQTPYSKDEIYSSHKIVSSDREGYTKVMLVIARRSLVSERVEAIFSAGMAVERVGVSTEGVYNWFSVAYPHEFTSDVQRSVVVIDVDSNYSDFMVLREGGPVFTRSILVGANQLMEEFDKWHEKFAEEAKHSIDLYQGEQRGAKVVKVILSGAGKNIQGLNIALEAKLGILVENAIPVKNMRIKDSVNVLQDPNFNFVSVSALFGIAIRHKELDLDMTPHDLRIQRKMERKRKQLMVMGVLATSIVMFISLILLTSIYSKNAYLDQLKEKIAKVEPESKEVEEMRKKISLVANRLDAKGTTINLLSEIYKLTPREVSLSAISISERDRATLKGRANALSDVYKYAKTLEDSGYFEKVNTNYATTKRENNVEYADFEVVCYYEKR